MSSAPAGEADAQTARPAGSGNEVVVGATGRTQRWDEVVPAELDAPTAALVGGSDTGLPWVAAHVHTRQELLLAPAARVGDEQRAELAGAGFRVVTASGRSYDATRAGERDRLWLLTSGSTGRPKQVGHTLGSLTTVAAAPVPLRWWCPYAVGSYAWWQLVTLSLAHPGQDLVVADPAGPADWASAARRLGVTAVSGTPTFWRRSLMTSYPELTRLPLLQVTLGGEPVDQAVLDDLQRVFPHARVSWIYASSELGASVVVHDGRAGFPVAWLDRDTPGRPMLSVVDSELVLGSPHHAEGHDGMVRTGDRVEVTAGRVHVVGRMDRDEINVGGVKVSAGLVRHALQAHPDVRWARVAARRAPLVGAVVAAEVVLRPGADAAGDHDRVLADWCRARLPEAAVPRRLRLLDQIPANDSLKSDV
jgi:acyl-coenzyme A synthetase/AMP-(fatty) acid ligase